MPAELAPLLHEWLDRLPPSLLALIAFGGTFVRYAVDLLKRRLGWRGERVKLLAAGVSLVAALGLAVVARFRPAAPEDWLSLLAVAVTLWASGVWWKETPPQDHGGPTRVAEIRRAEAEDISEP